MSEFDYSTAFARNLGFLSAAEQEKLRNARVAIAGLGGTGGAQVHALARMGIGRFNLADPDIFELINFNRQAGARMDTIGRSKVDVCEEIVLGINPEAGIHKFAAGISEGNIDEFLGDADIVVDSLDFYCFQERFLLYRAARERGLWVLTAPPLGFGFTLLVFDPNGMTFEDYFGFEDGMSERELVVSLIAGIAPRPYMMAYMDKEVVSTGHRQLPSVGAAPFMIAGVIATEVTRVLTNKRPPFPVPSVLQYDAMLQRFRRTKFRFGMRSPLQMLKKALLRQRLPR